MSLNYLDHVNIRTARLPEMTAFYGEVLGLREGPRPPFEIGGAWLYCGQRAAVHLVEVSRRPRAEEPAIEHFAFRATGLRAFLDRLVARAINHEISVVPEWELRQVFLRDPDGNHIEVTFAAGEAWEEPAVGPTRPGR